MASSTKPLGTHIIPLSDILRFCFPPGQQHANSTTRLFLLGQYGPLHCHHTFDACLCHSCRTNGRKEWRKISQLHKKIVSAGDLITEHNVEQLRELLCADCFKHCSTALHLKAGFQGRHIVSALEISQMEQELIVEDVLAAYGRAYTLSREEQQDFLSGVSVEHKTYQPMTKEQVRECFKNVPRLPLAGTDELGATQEVSIDRDDEKSHTESLVMTSQLKVPRKTHAALGMDFEDVKKVIAAERRHHVKRRSLMYPPVVHDKKPPPTYTASDLTRSIQRKGKIPDQFGFTLSSRLLHQRAHKIANLADCKDSSLTNNVYLMRDLAYDKETNWNGTFAYHAERK